MRLVVEISLEGAALAPNEIWEQFNAAEAARILVGCSYMVSAGDTSGSLRDVNGNTVGTFALES